MWESQVCQGPQFIIQGNIEHFELNRHQNNQTPSSIDYICKEWTRLNIYVKACEGKP